MKKVYEPSNSLEGHMLQDILRQRGIDARLEGAGLQGAVGELPAIGLVRLLVEEEDFAAAREVIAAWERTPVPDPVEVPSRKLPGALVGALVGLVLGFGGAYAWFRVPTNSNGNDYDGDGVLDERWNYSPGGTLISSEGDRNFDRQTDVRWKFNSYGHPESSESDDDFDGTFESRTRFLNGQPHVTLTRTAEKDTADMRYLFRHGVLTTIEFLDKRSGNPLRVENYVRSRLASADIDSDRDGKLDRRHVYDELMNVTSTEAIEAPY